MADSTPFSFHCMICFEEFHPDDRYPVVLPCGHTYVCNECANRLEKCMECRLPLYTRVQPKNTAAHPSSVNSNGRSHWSSSRSAHEEPQRPQPIIKKRLPLPKNVVLLSLIEATELATQDAQKKATYDEAEDAYDDDDDDEPPTYSYDPSSRPGVYHMNSMLDSADDEEVKIKMGTSVAVGVAGTYAVAVREGMEILPSQPHMMNAKNATEDVDSIVQHTKDSPKQQRSEKSNAKLSFGDRVQVVSFDGKWAKLARGYGYVRADRNQLVKVGGSVDRACKLEAMLRNLSIRRKELRVEQSKIDNHFVRLMKDLQFSMQNDEDLTVILADAFKTSPADIPEEATEQAEEKQPPVARQEHTSSPTSTTSPNVDIQKPNKLPSPTRTRRSRPSSNLICFAGEGLFSGYNNDDEARDSTSPGGLLSQNSLAESLRESLFPSASHPSPSALRAGAQAWRERHGQCPRNGVDFKTGMSGHMALFSTHAHPHQYLDMEPQPSGPMLGLPKMSSHTGLTVSKLRIASILSSLTLPSFSSPPAENRQEVQPSGSM